MTFHGILRHYIRYISFYVTVRYLGGLTETKLTDLSFVFSFCSYQLYTMWYIRLQIFDNSGGYWGKGMIGN